MHRTRTFAGSELTTLDYSTLMLDFKATSRCTDEAFDVHLRFVACCLVPQPNHCPPSLYLMKAVVGVEEWQAYQFHICPNPNCPDGYVWEDDVLPSHHNAHQDDACPSCHAARFEKVRCMLHGGLRERHRRRMAALGSACS